MFTHRYREGERVKACRSIFGVPDGTRGTITRRYASIWDLYEVHFETNAGPRVVWAEELEADEPADVQSTKTDP